MIIILCFISYLIGSLSFAVILSKLLKLPDPRTLGSNNPGATNVLRLAGKKYAAIVLVADGLKGFIPVYFCKHIGLNPTSISLIALAAVLGHIYPIFLKFKGGKGVATALGAMFALNGFIGLFAVITWLIIAIISRYSSLAAIVALIFTPVYAWLYNHSIGMCLILTIMSLIIIYKHAHNIKRLFNGIEPRIGAASGSAL